MTEDEYSRIENGQVLGEAILFMKSRKPNPDGTIGYMVKSDTPEWAEWLQYFKWNGMARQLSFMQSRWTKPEGYMVPHRSPQVFDPAYRPRKPVPFHSEAAE